MQKAAVTKHKKLLRLAEIKGEMTTIAKAAEIHSQAIDMLDKRADKLTAEAHTLAKDLGIDHED